MASLQEKIEHIRQQPESVRLRYVWLCVSISMFFVITIWILSIQTNFPKQTPAPQTPALPTFPTPTSPTTGETTPTPEPSIQEMLEKSNQSTAQ